jgi:hypothetical protein
VGWFVVEDSISSPSVTVLHGHAVKSPFEDDAILRWGEGGEVVDSSDHRFFLAFQLPVLHSGPCPSLREPEPWKEKVIFSKEVVKTISDGGAEIKVRGRVSIGNVIRELLIGIKYRNNVNVQRDMAEGVKEGGECAPLLGGVEHIVGDVKRIVVENCEYSEVEVRNVEEHLSDEDFSGGWVFEGRKRGFMYRRVW